MKTKRKTPSFLYAFFGLWFVWSPTFGTTEATVFPSLGGMLDALFVSRIVILVAFTLGCGIVVALGRHLSPIRKRASFVWGCACALAAGMLAGAAPAFGAPVWLLYLGSVLRGVPSAFFVMAWIENLADLDGRGVGVALFEALALYGAVGVCIPWIAESLPFAAAALLFACPLTSCYACLRIARNAQPKVRSAAKPEPMSSSARLLFAGSNLAYGFIFGIMLSHFSTLGNTGLYASFALASLALLVVFFLCRKPVDLSVAFRAYAIAASLLLLACAFSMHGVYDATPVVEAAVWSVQIFFTIVIFTDAEFSLPGAPGKIAGSALAIASIGIIGATVLFPPAAVSSLSAVDLIAATFAGIVFLSAVFLPNGRTWVREWGFSSFAMPESNETFLTRRCGELTAQFGLTTREFEIMQMLVRGYRKDEISEALFISPLTTKTHMRNVYGKLGVHTQDELIHLVESGSQDESGTNAQKNDL